MTKIEAIIESSRMERIKADLLNIGVREVIATEVRNFIADTGQTEVYRARRYEPPYLLKMKIEMAVPDNALENALAIINEPAEEGVSGADQVFVFALSDVWGRRKEKRRMAAV